MQTAIHQEGIEGVFDFTVRLDSPALYKLLTSIAQTAILQKNRCALVSAIASILSNSGEADIGINEFIRIQIDRELDCGACTKCTDVFPES
jgi:hypothetical protein